MAMLKHVVVGLGELLWDLLPGGKQLGGAPGNFAYITNLLGNRGIPASRVGQDALGDEALRRLTQLGLSTEFVQRDFIHPTGTVKVEIEYGQPRFEILQPVAWDFLEWTQTWQQLAHDADAVCFGSLAQRSVQAQSAIRSFLAGTRPEAVRIFDINLRQKFYSKAVLEQSMKLATILKLNHDEFPILMRVLGLEDRGMENSARTLLSSFALKLVSITRGQGGSLLVAENGCSQHPGFKVKVADTIGAGDAFTAALVHAYLGGESLTEMNERANRVGAWVATQAGGMPAAGEDAIERVLAGIS